MNQQTPKPTSRRHSFASRLFGYDIFISYALGAPPRGTLSYASNPARRLRQRDFTVFFSEDEAPPGDQLDSTLRTALHRSKALVVIANRGTLHDPRWVRTEVQEFRRRHPHRPAIPISVGGALEDPALSTSAQEWLRFQDTIWLNETDDAVGRGIASETLIDRLATAPTRRKSNVTWRWVVRSVVASLIILTMTAAGEWYLRVLQRRNAESRRYSARAPRAVETDPADALQLAIRAGELGDNPDSEAALRSTIGASHLVAVFSHDGGTTDADFASTQVLTVGNDSRIRRWSATSGRSSQGTDVVSGVPGGLRGITVSPNGTRAAVWDFNKVVVWDLISKRELHRLDTFDRYCQGWL